MHFRAVSAYGSVMMERTQKRYPSDVSDEEWAFVAPYLTLMDPEAPQREQFAPRGVRRLAVGRGAGAAWRMMPGNFPPWEAVYQQT